MADAESQNGASLQTLMELSGWSSATLNDALISLHGSRSALAWRVAFLDRQALVSN
ncbi:MAG: hypothetical protein RKO66_04890 [Candidatus Contendobacter sp.]|nr:hypothetical protein [Candidatus Contendobacter sp.]